MVTQSLMETPLMEITKNQNMVFEVEAFLEEGFKFRRNVINGKVEICFLNWQIFMKMPVYWKWQMRRQGSLTWMSSAYCIKKMKN